MKKAPTIIAKIRGYTLLGEKSCYAYAFLRVGDGLMLSRERDNVADGNAVLLEVPNKKHGQTPCGYIDRDNAKKLARWIDAGWLYTGEIVREPTIVETPLFLRIDPTPEAEVKCTPIPPITLKTKRKQHDKV